MDAEAFAAASGPPIVLLFRAWLEHTLTQAEILVSDQPAWAPPGMIREAAQVAACGRALGDAFGALPRALAALGREVPDGFGGCEGGW